MRRNTAYGIVLMFGRTVHVAVHMYILRCFGPRPRKKEKTVGVRSFIMSLNSE